MAKLEAVPLLTTPDEFAGLHPGDLTLHNVPFFSADCAGGALQVGLLPEECVGAPKCDLAVNINEDPSGQHTVEIARTDREPFNVEWSDDGAFREPALSRPVESLRFCQTNSPWLTVEVPGEEPLRILRRPGVNYLVQVLTMFAMRAQEKEQ